MLTFALFISFIVIARWLESSAPTPTAASAPVPALPVQQPEPAALPAAQPAQAMAIAEVDCVISPAELAELLPAPEPQPPVKLGRDQLRSLCRELGIKWRDAKGKNKHLTCAEMREQIALHENFCESYVDQTLPSQKIVGWGDEGNF